ncbi:NmrA family protein [Colletotrichum truncatum]|uniref:NmrA family protein n=1 Tax=Colletotrichum truncatum TaxID=5467 RepID=A0ACC3Z8A8_COLTU|nr:NmrA family protein [Colletotrichum truncatum]KAF6789123.1 NmrA family protein [Colletotrichum truncatum]
MQIVVVPASSKTGQSTIRALLDAASEPIITGVYRDPAKAPSDFKEQPRFRAVKGDVADVGSLSFAGADVVVTITPPQFSESRPISRAREMAANVKYAIGRAGDSVKRLVYVSSIGAQFEHGTGELRTNYEAEQALVGAAPEVVFIRCAYFMENWATALETVKTESPFFYSVICPADYKIPMVAVSDIGKACAAQALAAGSALRKSPYIFELHGPDAYSTNDVKKAFEESIGKTVEVKLVEDDQLEEFFAQAFQPPMSGLFVEMTRSFLPGGIAAAEVAEGSGVQRGEESLNEAIGKMLKG